MYLVQESRVSKAVEVMIQHVENLKRMYAKEHAELEELREAMQQSDRSSCPVDRGKSQKLPKKLYKQVGKCTLHPCAMYYVYRDLNL